MVSTGCRKGVESGEVIISCKSSLQWNLQSLPSGISLLDLKRDNVTHKFSSKNIQFQNILPS